MNHFEKSSFALSMFFAFCIVVHDEAMQLLKLPANDFQLLRVDEPAAEIATLSKAPSSPSYKMLLWNLRGCHIYSRAHR